jgi:hypothetical protein
MNKLTKREWCGQGRARKILGRIHVNSDSGRETGQKGTGGFLLECDKIENMEGEYHYKGRVHNVAAIKYLSREGLLRTLAMKTHKMK